MKSFFLIVTCIISAQLASAQLKATPVCPAFTVDVLGGNINKLYPKSTFGEIQKLFPCYTDMLEKGTETQCAGLFYKDKGINFYTERNYFEINENFKGKMTPALMGASRSSLFSILGNPKMKDVNWDAFQTEYGTLVLYYDKAGKINKLQVSSRTTDGMKLCD